MENLTESGLEPQTEPPTTPAKVSPGFSAGIVNFFKDNREALRIWLGWRLVLFILPVFAAAFVPLASSLPKPSFNNGWEPWLDRLVWDWSQSDSKWYLLIAGQGYINEQTTAFYPLYPLLVRVVGFIFWLGQPDEAAFRLAGVVVASVAALVFCVYFMRLLALDYTPQLTRLGLLYFAAFPTSFYLFAVYTESLFLALSVAAFYFVRQNKWWLALVLAALAVVTRQQGLIVVAALLVEYGHQREWRWRRLNRQMAWFGLPVLSLAAWLGWNWLAFGNALMPVVATQKYWGRYMAWPWYSYLLDFAGLFYREPGQSGFDPVQSADNPALALPILNVATTTLFIILAVAGYRAMRKGQFRAAYWVLCLGCLLQPLISPVPGDPLESLPRYLLLSFPSFVLLARWGQRSPLFNYCYLGLSLALAGLLVARFTLGYWVA
ncbi:MAG: hypothetical protein J0I20_24420 [Chloroflexi bacterium]|nr:hypothetical protein [Chloroflexota bacterium]OJV99730.1 MAG: hypothetical protein BGO39_12300 [Chloroflexi bacterium 54-19]